MSQEEIDRDIAELLPTMGEHKMFNKAAEVTQTAAMMLDVLVASDRLGEEEADLIYQVMMTHTAMIHTAEHAIDFLRANPMGIRIAPN